MNFLVVLSTIFCVVLADTSQKQEVKLKTTAAPLNSIPQKVKYEAIYQPMKLQPSLVPQQQVPVQYLQPVPKQHYIPVQILQKPYYLPQNQNYPPAMIIIAQPALVPQSLLYGSQTQQLLNYFHSNPQAKQQLLYGGYPQQQQQQPTTYMQPVVAPTVGSYVLTAAPTYQTAAPAYQTAAPTYQVPQNLAYQTIPHSVPQPQYQQITQAPSPPPVVQSAPTPTPSTPQIGHIAQLAQLAAQQYVSSPLKAAPAIVTGFENFTPEQQAQIKAQLSTHLGNNYHAVASNSQYSSKYTEPEEFVPSAQFKMEPTSTTAGDVLKTRYSKAKN